VLYRLIDPQAVREMFEDIDLLTYQQIADECGLSLGAVRKAFRGEGVQPETIRALAAPLKRRVRQIAERVNP
jgi:AcrR family transcriptional regulator